MGIILGKFRKKKSTYELLERLDNDIKEIEAFRLSTEQTQKKMVGRFVFISVCVYIVTAFILYFYFFPASLYDRIMYMVPLVISPILLFFIKRGLTWYYSSKIRKKQKKLTSLKDEKKKILDEVMDKETYKVAKTILEKFAPEQIRNKSPIINVNESTPDKFGTVALASSIKPPPGLRYRGNGQSLGPNKRTSYGVPITPVTSSTPFVPTRTPGLAFRGPQMAPGSIRGARLESQSLVPSTMMMSGMPGTPLPLPRAVLPRDRTVLDKMVDYLVGDGPSNRYALICRNCSSHNGMALQEEFEYLSFRCCYCMTFNPARKKRPVAPKLESSLAITPGPLNPFDSDGDSTDSDSERASPIITEPKSDTSESGATIENERSDAESEPVQPLEPVEPTLPMEVDEVSTSEIAPSDNVPQVAEVVADNATDPREEINTESITEDTKTQD